MELAVLLAAGLEDWIDFGVIIGILCLNAAVGWYQEKQAADVVASLKGDIAMRAIVIRDSTQQEILARELVPGDVVSESSDHEHPSTTLSAANRTSRSSLAKAKWFRVMPKSSVISTTPTVGKNLTNFKSKVCSVAAPRLMMKMNSIRSRKIPSLWTMPTLPTLLTLPRKAKMVRDLHSRKLESVGIPFLPVITLQSPESLWPSTATWAI
jgi:hypothetical protein